MGNADSKEPAVGAGFILFSDDHSKLLLLQDERTGKWGFPKGHREPTDASDIQTAIRECTEETGLKESNYEILPGTLMYHSYLFWYAKLRGYRPLTKGPNSEIRDLQWIPVEDILERDMFPTNRYLRSWKYDMLDPASKARQMFRKHFEPARTRQSVRKTRKRVPV